MHVTSALLQLWADNYCFQLPEDLMSAATRSREFQVDSISELSFHLYCVKL